jgi:motility quorum-sensing regulator / GCU-specific mRNA interferase toxin
MAEKLKPTYALATFMAWAQGDGFTVTKSALQGALALGFTREDMVDIISTMAPAHFFKSMTSYADHRVWQDVYHVPSVEGLLYIKFQADVVTEFVLLSFKEKADG